MKAGTRDLSQKPATAEDDDLKRNTDCVYFLASPLTCKKGSECEYRHSEDARMNPRDCWFWLNGNCLNAKCSFRHPPLDGLLGTKVASPGKLSLPPAQTMASTQFSATRAPTYNSGKQGSPCIYFQKGLCLKGDRCPFMHGPQHTDNLVPQLLPLKVSLSVTEPQTVKKALGSLEKRTKQKKIPQANAIKPLVPPTAKQPTKAGTALSKNGIAVAETMPPPISFDDDMPRYNPTNVPPVIGGNTLRRTYRGGQAQPLDDPNFQNGKEPGDFLRGLPPGLDVLVDDEFQDSDYHKNEDEFRMTARGRHLDSVNGFDYGRSADYNSLAKFNRETYDDPRSFDRHGNVEDQYAWEQHRVYSERISDRPSVPEKREFTRAEGTDQIDESDLRYRLLKQRRTDGSGASLIRGHHGDLHSRDDRGRHVEDQRHQGYSRRDSRHLLPHESSISNRLQGRISLLGRPPDSDHSDSHLYTERDRGRNRGRSSPGRPSASSHRGKLQDRITQRVQDDLTSEGRNFKMPSIRRDEVDNNALDFAGPKSLAELKGAKVSWGIEEKHAEGEWERKNTKIGKLVGRQASEDSVSYEGPASKSVILKRKREEKETDFGDGIDSVYGNSSNGKGSEKNQVTSFTEKQSDLPSKSNKAVNHIALGCKEERRSTTAKTFGTVEDVEEEGLISAGGDGVTHEGQSSAQKESELETEDVMLMDRVEDQELEIFEQREGEFDYDQVHGGELKTEEDENVDLEDENVDPEDEYLDDEDGDDFAKRIGVMFS